MSPYQFLKQLSLTPAPGGDGVRVVRPLNLITDLRTSAGLVLTGATVPAVAALETNALGVQVAASQTAAGSFVFQVPADYDRIADELKINILANSAGATDTPILDATVFRKRAGAALSADLNPTAASALSDTAAIKTIDVSGESLLPGDVLTVNLITGAHTTDAVNIYSVEVQYKSAIVFADPTAR